MEVLHDSNSTGIISSIRNRLEHQKEEIIELTDTLSDSEDVDVLPTTNSMSLVPNEHYNAVYYVSLCNVVSPCC